MRFNSIVAVAAGLLFAGAAVAQDAPPAAPVSSAAVTPALTPDNTLNLDLSTGGRVVIQLRPDVAPQHVERIRSLARSGFYNGITFHRVIEGFMAQTGDPTGTGAGGSPLPDLAAEFNVLPHVRGAVSAARAEDKNSANSQFFIMFVPRLALDNDYTVFGRVVSGMNFVDTIQRGEPPLAPSRIVRASIGSDNVPPMSTAELQAMATQQAAITAKAAAAQPASAPAAEVAPAEPAPAAEESAAPVEETTAPEAEATEQTESAVTPQP